MKAVAVSESRRRRTTARPGKAPTPVIQESGSSGESVRTSGASDAGAVPHLTPLAGRRNGSPASGPRPEVSSRLAGASIVDTAARTNAERRSSPVRNPSSREACGHASSLSESLPCVAPASASSRSIPSSRARLRIAAERAVRSCRPMNDSLPSARVAALWLRSRGSRDRIWGSRYSGVGTHADDAIGRASVDVRK